MARLLTYDGQVIDPTAYIYIYIYVCYKFISGPSFVLLMIPQFDSVLGGI